jgi:putative membrane protein insertion efficiency factor
MISAPSATGVISAEPEMQPEHRATPILTWPCRLALTGVTSLLDLYHALIAPLLTAHSGSACRFDPSCSRYARIAIAQHGLKRGGYLSIRRLARCHPWGGHGYDPVPQPQSLPTSSYQGAPWTHDS